MKQVMRASVLLLTGLLAIALLFPPVTDAASQESRRVALVIGNNAYRQPLNALQNAVNDARSMREALQGVGFVVQIAENTSLREMDRAVRSFTASLSPGDIALFFYAGHAFQTEEGENCLMPTDFDAVNEVDAFHDSYAAQRLQSLMERSGARLRIIILDACRNNPYSETRSGSRGLAEMNAGQGTCIIFAAAAGRTASDNRRGNNGLFTSYLVEALDITGLTIDQVFRRVGAEVLRESSGGQQPWISSSIYTDFYFIPPAGETAAPPESEGEPVQPEVSAEAAVGTLAVTVNVAGAHVVVDGRTVATSREPQILTISNLPIGYHSVTVRRDGYRSNVVNRQVALRRYRTEELEAWLEPEAAETVSTGPIAEGEIWRDRAGLEYVYIPPGSFMMGAVPGDSEAEDNESPRHRVTISRGFRMSRTEVTVRAYKRFCDATGRSMPPAPESSRQIFNPGWRYLDHPILHVTWHDAVAYCEWPGVRLPTEAEWEYAARGGQDGRIYVWGNNILPIVNGIKQANIGGESCRRANPDWDWSREGRIFSGYDDDYAGTSPVGSFTANGLGLYDMAGNVWEWCSDWYNSGYYSRSPSRDPQGPSSGEYRVSRGGSWGVHPRHVRAPSRSRHAPGLRYFDGGFRCVRDLD